MTIYHKDSLRFRILEYLFFCCVIPKRVLRFLGNDTKSVQNAMRKSIREGILREERIHGRAYLILNKPLAAYEAFERYVFADYEMYYPRLRRSFYRNDASTEAKQKMQRLNQISESSIFMAEAGVRAIPGQKVSLELKEIYWEEPTFYQSLEVKQYMESEEARAMGSRATGCICWKNEVSMVFSLSDDVIKIGEITEKLNLERYYGHFGEKVRNLYMEDAYIFTWKYEKVHEKLELTRSYGLGLLLDGTYENYYLLPYTREGKRLLALLFKPRAKEEVMSMLIRTSWRLERGTISIEADGVDDEGVYVFNYLIPNVYRFKKFMKAARMLSDKKFHVYCYGFQEEAVSSEAGPNVTYSVYDLEAVEHMYEKRMRRRMDGPK